MVDRDQSLALTDRRIKYTLRWSDVWYIKRCGNERQGVNLSQNEFNRNCHNWSALKAKNSFAISISTFKMEISTHGIFLHWNQLGNCWYNGFDFTFFLDELYLLVTAGWSKDKQITETELIDLKNPFTMCKKFPGNFTWKLFQSSKTVGKILLLSDFPSQTKSMVYRKISEYEILVCGGNQVIC